MKQQMKDKFIGAALGAIVFFALGTWGIWYTGGFCWVFLANWSCAY
jgi:hypothetical protein